MSKEERDRLESEKKVLYNNMILTTSPSIEGKPIMEYKGIVGAQSVAGINMFKDMFAGLTNFELPCS